MSKKYKVKLEIKIDKPEDKLFITKKRFLSGSTYIISLDLTLKPLLEVEFIFVKFKWKISGLSLLLSLIILIFFLFAIDVKPSANPTTSNILEEVS